MARDMPDQPCPLSGGITDCRGLEPRGVQAPSGSVSGLVLAKVLGAGAGSLRKARAFEVHSLLLQRGLDPLNDTASAFIRLNNPVRANNFPAVDGTEPCQ
jgi:hypothetical protein